MDEIKPIHNAVHVCSLNTSWLKRIAKQAVEEADAGEKVTAYRLMWLNVAMAFNRQVQMQYILKNLGSKGKSPKFRAIRMGTFWHKWKREVLRTDWATLRECVDMRVIQSDLRDSSRFFESQRIELAARAFQNSPFLKNMPISDILTPRPVDNVFAFTTPGSNRPGYYNQGYNYVESTALSTMSDVSDSETETQELDPWDRPLEEQFKEKAVERRFKNINFTEDPKAKREENPEEKEETTRSNIVPGTDNPPENKKEKSPETREREVVAEEEKAPEKEHVEEKSVPVQPKEAPKAKGNAAKYLIAAGVVAIVLVLIFFFVFQNGSASVAAKATDAAKTKK